MRRLPFQILLFGILLYCIRTVHLLPKGICSISPIVCCPNYQLNETGDGCKECDPGYYKLNCTNKCPKGYFGELCINPCTCKKDQLCDHVIGCTDVLYTAKTSSQAPPGHCPKYENGCCRNYYKKGNDCLECSPGYYEYNCSNKCPEGYFGKLCVFECKCNWSLCNHVNGCIDVITSTEDLLLSWNGPLLPTVTSVAVVIVIIIIVGLICYSKRKIKEGYQPKHINNASQRQASCREEQSEMRQFSTRETQPCQPHFTCGETSVLYPENSENSYAQISDTARLMPRTKHTPKEVGIPQAPWALKQPAAQLEDFASYDVLSLKAKGKENFGKQQKKTAFSEVKYSKKNVPPIVKNKPLPPINSPLPNVRKSFLFPGDTSDYLKQDPPLPNDRSSEAEINELPLPPAPPSSVHMNGFHWKPKKGKKPPPLPRKPPIDSDVYRDGSNKEGHTEQGGSLSFRSDNETESKSKKKRTSFLMPNKFLRGEPSMKNTLKKDMLNRRKTNGLSYNLSGLLDVEEMPPPDFSDGEEADGSQDQYPGAGNPPSALRKCQTVIKNKMNRISALKFANTTLDSLRYSFARPQH